VRCGAGLLHVHMGKSIRCGAVRVLYMFIWGNQCGAGLLHAYMRSRPNLLLPEMYSTKVYIRIIGDNNNYRYFDSGELNYVRIFANDKR
jgi:hypothetical protein